MELFDPGITQGLQVLPGAEKRQYLAQLAYSDETVHEFRSMPSTDPNPTTDSGVPEKLDAMLSE